MKKISTDDNFNNYIDKFIDVEIEGTIRKFSVSKIDSGSITTNAGILFSNTFSILRESPVQECLICEDPCAFSVPIIELNFRGKGNWADYNYLINNKINETHDVFVNNHKVCRIDTKVLSAAFNRLWLIPFYSNNVQIPNFFDDQKSSPTVSIQTSCVFFNPSFYNSKDWNSLTIQPVSAYNPSSESDPIRPVETFYTYFYEDLYQTEYSTLTAAFRRVTCSILTNKILLNSTGVSSVSCAAWRQYDVNKTAGRVFINSCYGTDCSYLSTDLKFGTLMQPASTFFLDLDPCQNPNEYSSGFTYDMDNYYTNISSYDYRPAYIETGTDYAPALRKYIFYKDCSLTDTIELYWGSNEAAPRYYLWFSDLGLNGYTGNFYVANAYTYGPLITVVDGNVTNSGPC
jgi:hypothetical protein